MQVSPIYVGCLKIGVVKPPAPPRAASLASLTSVSISMPGVDPHDVERRRQIALKALSERLKSTDSARHTQLPKSYPTVQQQQHHHQHAHHKHSQHSHQHHGQQHHHHHPGAHGHSHAGMPSTSAAALAEQSFLSQKPISNLPITTARAEPRMISTMSPIAIPMPAPPPKDTTTTVSAAIASTETVQSNESDLLINMETQQQ